MNRRFKYYTVFLPRFEHVPGRKRNRRLRAPRFPNQFSNARLFESRQFSVYLHIALRRRIIIGDRVYTQGGLWGLSPFSKYGFNIWIYVTKINFCNCPLLFCVAPVTAGFTCKGAGLVSYFDGSLLLLQWWEVSLHAVHLFFWRCFFYNKQCARGEVVMRQWFPLSQCGAKKKKMLIISLNIFLK